MKSLRDKVAIVTGSTSGIGKATASGFARAGAAVVVTGRRAPLGEEVVRALLHEGCEAAFCATDVSDPASVSRLVEWTVAKYGRLDILVNNAGIAGGVSRISEYPEADWDTVMSINLKGTWLCMKSAIPEMLRGGHGAIVNVSSDVGFVGSTFGIAPYVASKHGVIGLTRAAALEYATQSIRVNAVCPGLSDTDMIALAKEHHPDLVRQYVSSTIPMGRMGAAFEQAAAILWLCSDESSFVTGHALAVDGGILAK